MRALRTTGLVCPVQIRRKDNRQPIFPRPPARFKQKMVKCNFLAKNRGLVEGKRLAATDDAADEPPLSAQKEKGKARLPLHVAAITLRGNG